MNQVNKESSIAQLLSKHLVHHSLHHICDTSLKLIENASKDQISTAIRYNYHQLNTLLIQLLAINFIGQNQQKIKNDIEKHDQQIQSHLESLSQCQSYCERQLLSLSPIIGFSRKNYFVQCNISDDVRMKVLSYLKPIEIFQTIPSINKRFNKNVKTMHQSYSYENMFCNKNFVFESYEEMCSYLRRHQHKQSVDWRMDSNGCWVCGAIESTDVYLDYEKVFLATVGTDEKKIYQYVKWHQVAPSGRMTRRPANMERFVNILKRGYFSEVCDVNLKDFCFLSTSGDRYINLVSNVNEENQENEDIWRCGWIDFDWTWEQMVGSSENSNFLEISKNIKRQKFPIFQIRVQVDITQEYESYDEDTQLLVDDDESFNLVKTENDEYLVSLVFHSDDVKNITYFGHKTTQEEQLKAKRDTFNWYVTSDNDFQVDESKVKILQAVGYPNYCILTPNSIFNAISKTEEERTQFNKLYNKDENTIVWENECMNIQVSQNGVNKVYYDKIKDELLVKIAPNGDEFILDDVNAPPPLKQIYYLQHGSPCRLIDAKIVDSRLIDKVRNDQSIEYPNEKEKRYFELLRKWKGFIQVSIDITQEFDQFQERLKHDYFSGITGIGNSDHDEIERVSFEWDNRKYFVNGVDDDGMPYLNYDKKKDKITHNRFVLLDSGQIHGCNEKFNFFNSFSNIDNDSEKEILMNVFSFVYCDVYYLDFTQLVYVCKKWYHLHLENQDQFE